jgi:hypothetical protein
MAAEMRFKYSKDRAAAEMRAKYSAEQEAILVDRRERNAENLRFHNRRHFHSLFFNPPKALRSYPPSSWPAFERECRKWGLPRRVVYMDFYLSK